MYHYTGEEVKVAYIIDLEKNIDTCVENWLETHLGITIESISHTSVINPCSFEIAITTQIVYRHIK